MELEKDNEISPNIRVWLCFVSMESKELGPPFIIIFSRLLYSILSLVAPTERLLNPLGAASWRGARAASACSTETKKERNLEGFRGEL